MSRLWIATLLLLLITTAHAADLVKNGTFAEPAAGNPALPADWTLPAGGPWQRSATDGPQGGPCLLYSTTAATAAAPARGKCDFLTPTLTYRLDITAKCDAALHPVLQVMDLPSGKPIARLDLSTKPQWSASTLTFKPLTADVGLEIHADAANLGNQPAAPGKLWIAEVKVVPAVAEVEPNFTPPGENIALHKPYTMPRPSYGLCSDPDDKTQLTDGVYTEGHFWTRKTTVGWGGQPVFITIDLGQDLPIKGLSFNTAAGIADVKWPYRILVLVSPDGKNWYDAGNLTKLNAVHNNLPEYGQYAIRRLWTDQLNTHGRMVALYIEPQTFTFVDEIEVFRGDDSLLQKPYAGASFTDPQERMKLSVISDVMRAQFTRELDAVRKTIGGLPPGEKSRLSAQADKLAAQIEDFQAPPMEGFRAVLPVNDLEANIFKLNANAWRAQKRPSLRVWTKHRWDMLDPWEEPQTNALPALDVHLMNNETRSCVLNLSNSRDEDLRVKLRLTGLPEEAGLRVFEVLTVGTRRFVPVTSAMPELLQEGSAYNLTVPSGMTRQVWLSFKPEKLAPKTYTGSVQVIPAAAAGLQQNVPVKLTVYPLRFPDETTLYLGGWEYSDAAEQYGLTVQNKAALLDHLKEHHVNTTWASSSAMNAVAVDKAGNLVQPVNTTRFDDWVKLWPKAQKYMVYLAVGDNYGGSPMGSEEFNLRVGAFAKFWAQHMRDLGKRPDQLGVLIYDEPNNKKQYDIIVAWAKAIEAAAPEIETWEDPQPTEFVDAPVMFAAVDTLCPYRNPFLARNDDYRNMFLEAQKQGKTLWFYNADGPARTFDPFSFYLLQAWHAFAIGAKGSQFWAMADNGRVSCWNEYPAQGNGPYCPSYIDETSVTTSKYMEAVSESAQDYEYLTMLKDRIAELEKKGTSPARLAPAKALLIEGPKRVLSGEKGANYRWDEQKDRTIQDQVRLELLKALTDLQKL